MRLIRLIPNGVDVDKNKLKTRISWGVLLLSAFIILVTCNWKNLKYIFNLLKELHKLTKKNSIYKVDDDFILIHKTQVKDL